jgi:DNA helicase-2/ATP-dependent DNA helicase PcrA
MIARRQGFSSLHRLFTGPFASSKAKDKYEAGTHPLLKPFIEFLSPIVWAFRGESNRNLIDVFRTGSPKFHPQGPQAESPFKSILTQAISHAQALSAMWEQCTTKDLLRYCHENDLLSFSDRVVEHLERSARVEEYDDNDLNHVLEKADWLADAFFEMNTSEIPGYVNFVTNNTPLSTQHGVKGEEYKDVLVVFDDVEAAWNQYSFRKTLTPDTAGKPSEGQREKSEKLAYVCFSRAEENLRIIFFSQDAGASKAELVAAQFLSEEQITVLV